MAAGDAFVRRIDVPSNFLIPEGYCRIEPAGAGINIADVNPAFLISAVVRAAVVKADGKGCLLYTSKPRNSGWSRLFRACCAGFWQVNRNTGITLYPAYLKITWIK